MKKSILQIVLLLILPFYLLGQCPPSMELLSQTQIDDFSTTYPNCTVVNGNLSVAPNVTSLLGLSQLTEVSGHLNIQSSTQLANLQGLENISSIGGELRIEENEVLDDLSALTNVTTVEEGIFIVQNPNLEIIAGLFATPFTTKEILIFSNAKLKSISGFEGLTATTSDFEISGNVQLTTISGFNSLKTTNDFIFIALYALTDLSGFSELETINGKFVFAGLGVTSHSAFGKIDSVALEVQIFSNPSLVSLDNLIPNVLRDDLSIDDNPSLTDIQAVSFLTEIDKTLAIRKNGALTNVDAFSNLKKIGGSLVVTFNDSLADISGFQSIDSIGSWLIFSENGSIEDMTGFSSLKKARLVSIGEEEALVSLNGLQGLTSIDLLSLYKAPLPNLQGLENVTHVGDCFFGELPVLQDLSGLENLTTSREFTIYNCDTLESLSGLENLLEVSEKIELIENDLLNDISALENVNMIEHLDSLIIYSNPNLSTCHYENICDYLFLDGEHLIYGNEIGCNDVMEVIDSCIANQPISILEGNVWIDVNLDCQKDTGDIAIPNALLRLEPIGVHNDFILSADATGSYSFPVLARDYNFSAIDPSGFWVPCFEDTLITAAGINDTLFTDFYFQPQGDCPFIDWSLNVIPLRICGNRIINLDLCNYGTMPAEDILFTIDLGELLSLQSASVAYTTNSDGDILINIDSLDLFECNSIELTLLADCDSVQINDVLCIDVDLAGDALCSPDSTWDGSITRVSGYCENDSIYFELENIGTGDMLNPAAFMVDILIEDIVLLFDGGTYQLPSGVTEVLAYPALGTGFHLQADQTQGNPASNTANATVANCEDVVNDIIYTFFPNNNGDPFSETFCTNAVGSYDPNAKLARPRGTGDEHFIDKDWKLSYTIQFQNTGNDVAYKVVIRDTLSENLDLSTIRVQGASHDFTWALNADRELVFTFDDINLPDSTSNEPASHGMLSYTILPHQDILPGALIENRAGIYFDFNDPIITNTVFHTIRKPVVSTVETTEWCAGATYNGLAIWQDTFFLEIIEYPEYDSVHLTNLQVVDTMQNEVFVEVEIGTYWEQIEILGDTIISLVYPSQQGCDSIVTYHISALMVGTLELENTFEQVRIFPNPAATTLFIDPPKNIKLQQWSLTNLMGVKVWEKTFKSPSSMISVSLESIPAGVYFLQAKGKGDRQVWKIVIN